VGTFVYRFVEIGTVVLTVLVLGRVLVSWVDSTGRGQLSRFLFQATEPFLAPIRRLLPPMGMIDFSPMVLIFVLTLVLQAIRA
jgi:YggT family protein